jgi:hypothetical protein
MTVLQWIAFTSRFLYYRPFMCSFRSGSCRALYTSCCVGKEKECNIVFHFSLYK